MEQRSFGIFHPDENKASWTRGPTNLLCRTGLKCLATVFDQYQRTFHISPADRVEMFAPELVVLSKEAFDFGQYTPFTSGSENPPVR